MQTHESKVKLKLIDQKVHKRQYFPNCIEDVQEKNDSKGKNIYLSIYLSIYIYIGTLILKKEN